MLPTLRRRLPSKAWLHTRLKKSIQAYHERDPASDLSAQSGHVLRWMAEGARRQQDLVRMVRRYTREDVPLAYVLGAVRRSAFHTVSGELLTSARDTRSGTQPFGPLDLLVEPPILIPRSETEHWATELAKKLKIYMDAPGAQPLRILDLCSGSGCIGLLLAHELPASRVIGVDVLDQAVDLARRNALRNSVPNAQYHQLDIFDDTAVEALGRFDCIIANPPYIPRHEYETLDASVKQHESPLALLGERPRGSASQDGLDFYRRIADVYPLLRRGNPPAAGIPSLVVEVGHQQAQAVRDLVTGKGHGECKILKDYADIERSVWLYGNNK